jgi:hypothetical protein
MIPKFSCYVDESGQDTRGDLFIVSVVITEREREQVCQICEDIERASRKGTRKWAKTTYERRLAYIQQVLSQPILVGKLNFAVYHDSVDYPALTVQTVAQALIATGATEYKATVFVDGLPRALEHMVGLQLRQQGINAKKVRGVKKDENIALIRLADAVCGFVRDAGEGQSAMRGLLEQGLRSGVLKDLSNQ